MQVGDLNAGQVDIRAELVNESNAPQKIAVTLSSNSGEVKDQRDVVLAAKERKPYAFKGRIVNFSTTLLRFEAKDAAGTPLFVHEMPVVRSDKINVYAFNYPSFGLVRTRSAAWRWQSIRPRTSRCRSRPKTRRGRPVRPNPKECRTTSAWWTFP